MVILVHLLASFIASGAFGILFNAPKRTLLQCGLSGMVGWMVYILLEPRMESVFSTVAATFLVGVLSQLFARAYKKPVIIFSVAGIIPLVPGGLAYDAMRRFVENEYDLAVEFAARAFLLSGSIAIGLVLSEVLGQLLIRRVPRRLRGRTAK
ncbi:MAG: threonine/serine exporter family protein [Paenibacillaceae bacterium]|uniref:Threonine/serine exporter family protein n=1 Tax=Paenibacillus mellifer TaxID=2937794 RepID=A0A9X1XUU3_9BACL|nr:threonine/serine exporter family protein [Paenibacillus mellifer]MBW4841452.1 threonine/serine exporter family protein [Paenibacillaceae bacterium]MCK8485724.1 threonine/serine exporter family protein [Paenibacillus mellifer]